VDKNMYKPADDGGRSNYVLNFIGDFLCAPTVGLNGVGALHNFD